MISIYALADEDMVQLSVVSASDYQKILALSPFNRNKDGTVGYCPTFGARA